MKTNNERLRNRAMRLRILRKNPDIFLKQVFKLTILIIFLYTIMSTNSILVKAEMLTGNTLLNDTSSETEQSMDENAYLDISILRQTEITLGVGESWQIKSFLYGENMSASISYVSADSSIVNVDHNGMVTAVSLGTTTVTIQLSNHHYAICTITVKEAPVSIKVPNNSIELKRNEIYYLKPFLTAGYSESNFIYDSNNKEVVSVNEKGEMKALNYGIATITIATYNGIETNVKVQVTSSIKTLNILFLTDTYFKLAEGQSRTIQYKVQPDSAEQEATKVLSWKSGNTDIATVNKDGKVTAKKEGKVKIYLLSKDPSKKTVEITLYVTKRKTGTIYSEKGLSIVNTSKSIYSYENMVSDLKQLQKRYGDILQVSILEETYDKRKIYQVILGNPNAKKVLVQSAIHAREYMTTLLTMKQIEFYCKNYYTGMYQNQYFSELFDDVAFYVDPMVNPDGVTISQYGANAIDNKDLRDKLNFYKQKYGNGMNAYFRTWKANARGVNLNLNFDQYWNILRSANLGIASQKYKGSKPNSEIESQTLVKQFNKLNPKATISYHSTGSIIFWDYGQKGNLRSQSWKLVSMAKNLTSYSLVQGFSKYESAGFSDWVTIKKNTPAITIEIGKGACPLKINEFPSIWSKNKLIYLATADLYN